MSKLALLLATMYFGLLYTCVVVCLRSGDGVDAGMHSATDDLNWFLGVSGLGIKLEECVPNWEREVRDGEANVYVA